MITRIAALSLAIFALGATRTSARQGSVEVLKSPTGPGAAEGNLTTGPDGKVYLSWLEQHPDTTTSLKFSVFDGAQFGEAKLIRRGRDFMVNWADFPAMSVNKSGTLAVHWLQRHGTGSYAYDIRIATSGDAGRTWTAGAAPHADRSSTEKGFVAFWPEENGFGATWLDGRKADRSKPNPIQEMVLYGTAKAGAETPAELQLDERVCDCCQTTATVTDNGPIVAYRDRSADEIRDIYVVRRVKGTWMKPQPVSNDNWKINACPVNGPSLSASGQKVALAWYTGANDEPRVKFAFSNDAGASFGKPVVIDEGKPAGRVATVLLADGSALVSWIERTGDADASVRVRRVTADGRVMPAQTVAASTAGVANQREARASGFPRMASSGEYVYFAWTVPGRPSTIQVARAKSASFK